MTDPAYELVRSRRKTVAIQVGHDASVVVRAPLRMPKAEIAAFVQEKRAWILEKQRLMRVRAERHQPRIPASGEEYLLLGRPLMLAVTDHAQGIEAVGGTLAFPRAWLPDADSRLKGWYRAEAARVLNDRLAFWSGCTGIRFASARLSDARGRWGSCGGRGALNFTWRLVMAPMEAIDYVVVHELAHIEHHNHSRAFWARVGEILPDYKMRRQWLKDNSGLLRLL